MPGGHQHLGLLAEEHLGGTVAAAQPDPALLVHPVALGPDARHGAGKFLLRMRTQPDRADLPERELPGAFLVDIGLDPDRLRVDQAEDRVARLDHGAGLGLACDDQCVIGRAEHVLFQECAGRLQAGPGFLRLRAQHREICLGHG